MDTKRATGALIEVVAKRVPATNARYAGGESLIIKLLTATRHRHIGTVHEIVMPDHSVPHSHPKDYTNRDCTRIRAPEPHEQP